MLCIHLQDDFILQYLPNRRRRESGIEKNWLTPDGYRLEDMLIISGVLPLKCATCSYRLRSKPDILRYLAGDRASLRKDAVSYARTFLLVKHIVGLKEVTTVDDIDSEYPCRPTVSKPLSLL